eukprot:1177658-Prorocentrum_minimum.AAC.1
MANPMPAQSIDLEAPFEAVATEDVEVATADDKAPADGEVALTDAELASVDAEETSADAEETSADAEEIPADVEETPVDVAEALAEFRANPNDEEIVDVAPAEMDTAPDVSAEFEDIATDGNKSSEKSWNGTELSDSDVYVAGILLGLVTFVSASALSYYNKGNKIDDDKVNTYNFVLIHLGIIVSRNSNAETAACAFNGFW